MGIVLSVNIGVPRPTRHSDIGYTGIDKHPATGPVRLAPPAADGGSGLAGDAVCDARHHGGTDQAVYAYAREDLDDWQLRLGRELRSGMFGENLTTSGLDLSTALIGERWEVGGAELEVSVPRIPCRTFAGWLAERGWVRTFTQRAAPGTYLRVLRAGEVRAGDPVTVLHRPAHDVTVRVVFQALTTRPELLGRLVGIEALPYGARQRAARRSPSALDA